VNVRVYKVIKNSQSFLLVCVFFLNIQRVRKKEVGDGKKLFFFNQKYISPQNKFYFKLFFSLKKHRFTRHLHTFNFREED
jgi:hypothetical protein